MKITMYILGILIALTLLIILICFCVDLIRNMFCEKYTFPPTPPPPPLTKKQQIKKKALEMAKNLMLEQQICYKTGKPCKFDCEGLCKESY